MDPQALATSDKPGLRVALATGGIVDDSALDLTDIAARIPDFDRPDPLVSWLAHCARRRCPGNEATTRTGLIVGNLSYLSTMNTAFVESVWAGGEYVDPATGSPRLAGAPGRRGAGPSTVRLTPSTPRARRRCTRSNWPVMPSMTAPPT